MIGTRLARVLVEDIVDEVAAEVLERALDVRSVAALEVIVPMGRHVGDCEQEEGGGIACVVGRPETVLLDAGKFVMDLPGLLSGLRICFSPLVAGREPQLGAQRVEVVREQPVGEAVSGEVARITGDPGLVEPISMTQGCESNGRLDAWRDHGSIQISSRPGTGRRLAPPYRTGARVPARPRTTRPWH